MQTSKRLWRLSMQTTKASLCLSPELLKSKKNWSLAPKLEGLPAYRATVPLWTYAKPQGRCLTAIPRHANLHNFAAAAAKCSRRRRARFVGSYCGPRRIMLSGLLPSSPRCSTGHGLRQADTTFRPMMAQEQPPKRSLKTPPSNRPSQDFIWSMSTRFELRLVIKTRMNLSPIPRC